MKTVLKSFILSIKKLPAMAGGYFPLLLMLAAAVLMFFSAHHALNAKVPMSLRIAFINSDKTEVSTELIASIKNTNGSAVELIEYERMELANRALELGEAEGILVILSGLGENLKSGSAGLEYLPAKGASSAQAARELMAGEAVRLGSKLRSEAYFEKLTGEAPNDEQKLALNKAYASELEREGSAVVRHTVFSGAANDRAADTDLFGAFYARYSGFSAFVIMLVLLMVGAFSGSKDETNCLERICSYSCGKRMGFISNLFALMLIGLVLLALSFLPSCIASAIHIAAGIAYVFCASSLALLLGRLSGSARAELASPLVAFLTALAGGCFTDTAALGNGFKTLAHFTPQGQYLAALNGEIVFAAILIANGIVLLILSGILSNVANRAVRAR